MRRLAAHAVDFPSAASCLRGLCRAARLVMDLSVFNHKESFLAGIFLLRVNNPNLFPNTHALLQPVSKLSNLVTRVAEGDPLKFCRESWAEWKPSGSRQLERGGFDRQLIFT